MYHLPTAVHFHRFGDFNLLNSVWVRADFCCLAPFTDLKMLNSKDFHIDPCRILLLNFLHCDNWYFILILYFLALFLKPRLFSYFFDHLVSSINSGNSYPTDLQVIVNLQQPCWLFFIILLSLCTFFFHIYKHIFSFDFNTVLILIWTEIKLSSE